MRPVVALPIPRSWLYTPRDARARGVCAKCGKPATPIDDLIAFDEYLISALCEPCQATIFVEFPDDFADTGER